MAGGSLPMLAAPPQTCDVGDDYIDSSAGVKQSPARRHGVGGARGEMTAMSLVHVNRRLGRAARVVYYGGVIEM